jgi:GH25 family lysozyme M1 (1,4-beta-N-acetylmuramidase)
VHASDFSEPWKRADRALVIDAYEYNPIDWNRLVGDKRIVGFINKGSDGLSPPYKCGGNATEVRLCKALWKRHAVARELFHTRRTVAKALGLKWGAYHLARPGNPIDQANNFIDFAEPAKDDLIALDIEENDPSKWMSLEDAEIFARHIHTRLGRWPVLYTNGSTALHIAEKREKYKILSRLPLWYARYKPAIGLHFPKGNWESYTLWQFAAGANCDARSCPYRVPGTPLDIDVNVASMSAQELRNAWPFGDLIEKKDFPAADQKREQEVVAKAADTAETVPLPVARSTAIAGGDVSVQFAALESGEAADAAKADVMHPQVVEKAETLVEKEVVELTGETVPTPIPRAEGKKKRGDISVQFVAVERVVVKAAMVETVLATAAYQSPFQVLLGKDVEPDLPVVMTNYVAATEIARRLRVRAKILEQRAAAAAPIGTKPAKIAPGSVSTAAMDDPDPVRSATHYSRKDLPVYLLRKIDGPAEPVL